MAHELKPSQMTSMGRLADILHVGFAVRPDWNPTRTLHPSQVHVEVFTSRQVQQLAGWEGIVAKLRKIFQEELGVAHITQFQTKLHQVSPGPGYAIDPKTQRSMSRNIQLAPTLPLPQSVPVTPTTTRIARRCSSNMRRQLQHHPLRPPECQLSLYLYTQLFSLGSTCLQVTSQYVAHEFAIGPSTLQTLPKMLLRHSVSSSLLVPIQHHMLDRKVYLVLRLLVWLLMPLRA